MSDAVLEPGRGGSAPLATSTGSELSEVRDWITLLKPRVVSLVVLTGIIGLIVAPGSLHPVLAAAAMVCIGLGAGAAGAINMWYDRDIDALMRRTAKRPIPAGRIAPNGALGYGVVLAMASVAIMGLATNWVAAGVLALSIAFYVVVYTIWLKRRTPQNIVIGGAAGAFPPVIGWAAVTGDVTLVPVILFAITFFWTPPHFWALSLWAHGDYARARVPMLPVTHGARETRRQVLLYTLVLVPVTLLPCAIGFSSWIYGAAAALLGAEYLRLNWLVWKDAQDEAGRSLTNDRPARRAFKFSLLYLAVLFLALAVDRLVLA
ncbi:heme o synthase [Plastoroseomonas hellenica]|uniref:heme o synthase n=1 Tax=Plastoroseomonas hellenica TaxID=2687306 RepID=UPI001BA6FE2C|nr:heme o synthase [Plastoroseomonas hellenica]MBR0644770.1 protoheme IX farnesyltransferase [Plastoroseomonas hellenica]